MFLVFFVRGGNIWSSDSTPFYNAGQEGLYWSSMARPSASSAYFLGFYSSGVNPSNYYNYASTRYYGFSLRCLIPTT